MPDTTHWVEDRALPPIFGKQHDTCRCRPLRKAIPDLTDPAKRRSATLAANDGIIATAGILEVMSNADVIRAAIGSAIAYMPGATLPLSLTIAVPMRLEPAVILAAVAAALALMSIVGDRAGHLNVPFTLVRMLVLGVGTITISYLAGRKPIFGPPSPCIHSARRPSECPTFPY